MVIHIASQGSRKNVVRLDAEVEIIDNDVVEEDDEKETFMSVSPLSREN